MNKIEIKILTAILISKEAQLAYCLRYNNHRVEHLMSQTKLNVQIQEMLLEVEIKSLKESIHALHVEATNS